MRKSLIALMVVLLVLIANVYQAFADGKPTHAFPEGRKVPNPAKDAKAKKPAGESDEMPHETKRIPVREVPHNGEFEAQKASQHGGELETEESSQPVDSAQPGNFGDFLAGKNPKPAKPAEKSAEAVKPAENPVEAEDKSKYKVIEHGGDFEAFLRGKPGEDTRQRLKEGKAKPEAGDQGEKTRVKEHGGEFDAKLRHKPGQDTREAQKKKASQEHPGELDAEKKPNQAETAEPKLRKVNHRGKLAAERRSKAGEVIRKKQAEAKKPSDKPVTGDEETRPTPNRNRSRRLDDGTGPSFIRVRNADGTVDIFRRTNRRPGRVYKRTYPVRKKKRKKRRKKKRKK